VLLSFNKVIAQEITNPVLDEDNTIFENERLVLTDYTTYPRFVGLSVYCDNTIVRNCTIIGYYINIKVYGDNNIIENNTIVGACDGIQIYDSRNTTIRNNYFNRNNWSIVTWMNSSDTQIYGNRFINSLDAALDIRNTSNVVVRNNEFIENYFNFIYKNDGSIKNIQVFNNHYDNNFGNATTWDELWVLRHNEEFGNKIIDRIHNLYKGDILGDVEQEVITLSIFSFSLGISLMILIFVIKSKLNIKEK